MRSISKHDNKEFTVRNFVCVIHKMLPEQALVETEVLFHSNHKTRVTNRVHPVAPSSIATIYVYIFVI